MRASKRLLLVYPSGNLEVNPTLTHLLGMLRDRGCQIDVLMEDPGDFARPTGYGDGVRMQIVPRGHLSLPELGYQRLPLRIARQALRRGLRQYRPWDDLAFFRPAVRRYDAVLGVDPGGIAAAGVLNETADRPLVYLSFEILFRDEVASDSEAVVRAAEGRAVARVELALLQDEERAAVFAREHSFPEDRIAVAPVAPPPQLVRRGSFLRDRLAIPEGKRLVLYVGQVSAWTGRDDFADMVGSWPEDYCLVVHSSSRISGRVSPDLRALIAAGRVFLSAEPIPRGQLTELVASAHFGLAPYKATGDCWETGLNVHHLGLASGKVSYYALCGLPILARSLPVYHREFAKYDCGRVYRSPLETGALLQDLERDYARHSQEASRFYRERLNPIPGLTDFCERLEHLIETRAHSQSRRNPVPLPRLRESAATRETAAR